MAKKWKVRGWDVRDGAFVTLDSGLTQERALTVLDYHMGRVGNPYPLFTVDSLPEWEREEVVDLEHLPHEEQDGERCGSSLASAVWKPA